jgi:hypothetical protein
MAKIRATDPKKVIKAAKNVAKKQSKKTIDARTHSTHKLVEALHFKE